ncbi:hypothetical protein D918_05258 [Trichuris suis]|nr:hypothetical protein D918_05258 [Trichuris suis]
MTKTEEIKHAKVLLILQGVLIKISSLETGRIFSNKYEEAKQGALQSWMFHRYDRIVEYHLKPFLPPPLTGFWHIYLVIQYFCCYSQWKLGRTLLGDPDPVSTMAATNDIILEVETIKRNAHMYK